MIPVHQINPVLISDVVPRGTAQNDSSSEIVVVAESAALSAATEGSWSEEADGPSSARTTLIDVSKHPSRTRNALYVPHAHTPSPAYAMYHPAFAAGYDAELRNPTALPAPPRMPVLPSAIMPTVRPPAALVLVRAKAEEGQHQHQHQHRPRESETRTTATVIDIFRARPRHSGPPGPPTMPPPMMMRAAA